MLKLEEIKKLIDYQIEIFKDIFVTKGDFGHLEGKINRVQNSLDALLKNDLKHDQEMTILGFRIEKTEDWIDQAAPKIGIEFEH